MYPPVPNIPGWSIEDGLGSEKPGKGYDVTSLQTVPFHSAGMRALPCWKENCFQQSDRLAAHVSQYSIALLDNPEILCELNEPLHYCIIQSSGWPSF